MKLLIVEDDQKTRDYLVKGLSEQGFGVDSATNGADAVTLASGTVYDLVILDTPPATHALDFLDAPDRLLRLLDNRMFRLLMAPTRAYLKVASAALAASLSPAWRLPAAAQSAATRPADLVLRNGKIITIDGRSSVAQAIAIAGGFALEAPGVLDSVDEIGDGITVQ